MVIVQKQVLFIICAETVKGFYEKIEAVWAVSRLKKKKSLWWS
jgi:hypothetical protein